MLLEVDPIKLLELGLVGRIPTLRTRRQSHPPTAVQPFKRPQRRRLRVRLAPRLGPRTRQPLQLAERGRVDKAVPRLRVRFGHVGSLLVPFFTGRLTWRSLFRGLALDDRPPVLDMP